MITYDELLIFRLLRNILSNTYTMLNTKLFKLLRGLSPEGMNHLRTYLAQRHKSSTRIARLFTYIAKYHPDFEQYKTKLSQEKVHNYVFKKADSKNNGQMYELSFRLCRDIENFLINTELNKDNMLRNVLLSRAYRKRGMDDFFTRHNEDTQEEIHKVEIPEQSHYDTLFRLTYDAAFHRNNVKLRSDYYSQLKEAEVYLDLYYLLHKLRILCECEILSGIIDIEKIKNVKNAEKQYVLKEPLLSIDYQNFIQEKPTNYLVSLYARIVELYDKKDPKIYRQLKEEITDETKPIDAENLSTLLVFLLNYCSRKSKENGKESSDENAINYTQEIFDLYEFAADEDLLQEEGYISEIHYLSLVKIAVAIQNFDRAREWIDYAEYTKPEYRENSRKLATAILHFAKEEYAKARKLLNEEIKWRNINYKITARDLLTKIYYEIGEYKLLDSHIANVRKAIQRNNDLSETQKTANYNFLNMVKELAKYKEKNAPTDEALFLLLQKRPMVYSEWCHKKFEALKEQSPAPQA